MERIKSFLVQKEDGAEGVVVAVVLIVVAIHFTSSGNKMVNIKK